LPYLLIFAASTAYQIAKGGKLFTNLVKEGQSATKRLEIELTFFRGQANLPLVRRGLKNIVQMAEQSPEQLQPSLVKLTTFVDYILHQPASGKVPLEQEVESLRNYVDLTQQGLPNAISLDIPQDLAKGQYEIRPMQLIPFVENAFKDCKSVKQDKRVALTLNRKKNLLTLIITDALNSTVQTETGSRYEIPQPCIKHKLMINCFRKLD
jgi:sensor histidine kinase YesM